MKEIAIQNALCDVIAFFYYTGLIGLIVAFFVNLYKIHEENKMWREFLKLHPEVDDED